ncbi:MAG: acetolactate decarboxylase [Actinomycetales bacterium]|jgi:acetolactate decarboxylase
MVDQRVIRVRRALHAVLTGHGCVDQSRSAKQLFAGDYSTSITVGAEFRASRLGLGVMHDLEGEVVSVNGRTWRIPADGQPRQVSDNEGLAFAMAAHGGHRHHLTIPVGSDLADITAAIDAFVSSAGQDEANLVCAVEIAGDFRDVILRTVAPASYPGEPLSEVIDHEQRFTFANWKGTVVGFRFPDDADDSQIPGLHLHAISSDEASGGHVRALRVAQVTASLWCDDLFNPRGLE